MENEEKEAYVKKYAAKLDSMESEAESWADKQRAQWAEASGDFRGQLDAWGDYAEDKWDQFTSKIEEGWHDLEAKWHNWRSE